MLGKTIENSSMQDDRQISSPPTFMRTKVHIPQNFAAEKGSQLVARSSMPNHECCLVPLTVLSDSHQFTKNFSIRHAKN